MNRFSNRLNNLTNVTPRKLPQDWWKNVKIPFGKKCRGWTMFQVYKCNRSYLLWLHREANLHDKIKWAVDAAIEHWKATDNASFPRDVE